VNIKLTETAATKLRELLAEEPEGAGLRIYVQGGGCSGFQYGFQFETELAEDDWALTIKDVPILIDSMSSCYLEGMTLDYKADAFGAAFNIINPNAKTTCGCGASFSAG
jgi:iron-sulfur cluster insertion protein